MYGNVNKHVTPSPLALGNRDNNSVDTAHVKGSPDQPPPVALPQKRLLRNNGPKPSVEKEASADNNSSKMAGKAAEKVHPAFTNHKIKRRK